MKGSNALIIFTALTVAGACVGCASPTAAPAPAATASPAATPVAPPAAVPVSLTSTPTAWATTAVSVTHNPPVPPLPVVSGIRYARHKEGFDRIVLDISGGLPGYSVKYVSELRRDGSDAPVTIPGEAFLLIVLHPAQAHREDGTPTVSGIHTIGLPAIKSYAVIGDYEGYTSIALGLTGVKKYHVNELSDRIYLDIAV